MSGGTCASRHSAHAGCRLDACSASQHLWGVRRSYAAQLVALKVERVLAGEDAGAGDLVDGRIVVAVAQQRDGQQGWHVGIVEIDLSSKGRARQAQR